MNQIQKLEWLVKHKSEISSLLEQHGFGNDPEAEPTDGECKHGKLICTFCMRHKLYYPKTNGG